MKVNQGGCSTRCYHQRPNFSAGWGGWMGWSGGYDMRPLGWIGEPNTTPTLRSHAPSIQSPFLMGWISCRQECRRHCGLFNPGKPCFMLVVRTVSELQESNSGVAKAGELCFSPASLELGIMMPLWLLKKVPSLHDGAMQPSCPLCLPQAPVPIGLSQDVGLDNRTCPSSDPQAFSGPLGRRHQPSLPAQLSIAVSGCTFRPGCSHLSLPPLLAFPCRQRGESGSHDARLAGRREDAVPLLTPQHATTITSGLPGSHAAPHLHLKP